jgi:hypothetical protein
VGDLEDLDDFRRRHHINLSVTAVTADGMQQTYPVLSLAEADEKFEELRKAGSQQIFIKSSTRTIRRLR